MIITPVINFTGDCLDAIRFYEDVFGVKADFILFYADADPADWDTPLTEEQQGYVYHAEMHLGECRVMFSDIITFEITRGTSSFLAVTLPTKNDVMQVYERLSQGSTILVPMKSTTYSSCFVNLVDKFGVRWALMSEGPEE